MFAGPHTLKLRQLHLEKSDKNVQEALSRETGVVGDPNPFLDQPGLSVDVVHRNFQQRATGVQANFF